MDDVSWKVFQFYSEHLTSRGIPPRLLVDGLPHGEDLLSGSRRWYDWDEHVVVCQRFADLCGGPDAAEAAAAAAGMARWTAPLRALAQRFSSPRHVYSASIRVFAPYLYRHIQFELNELSTERLELTITLPPHFQPCPLVFQMWRGAYRAAPRMLGLPDAHVDVSMTPHRAVYTIDLPPDRSLAHRLRMRVRAVLDHQQMVDQLSQHQLQLRDTFEALARAHEESERVQRTLLAAMPDLILRVARDGSIRGMEGARNHPLRPELEGVTSLHGDAFEAGDRDIPWTQEAHAHVSLALSGASDLAFEFALGDVHSPRHYECRTVALDADIALCVIRDITSERRLEHQLRVAERMASLGTLAAGVAHEINNPLMYVMANIQTLSHQIDPRSPRASVMQTAAREALEGVDRIREIVRGVKMFTRPEGTALAPINVNGVVESALRIASSSIKVRARIVVEKGSDVVARTNANQLEQILANLLINAAQALDGAPGAPSPSIEGTIWVRSQRRHDDTIAIEIEDNGPGISKAVRERIFDPFFTTKAVGAGTGLGLSISHRLATQLEGTIAVESTPGKGAKFTVILPAAPVAEAAGPPSSIPPPSGESLRILLVDDEVLITKTLKLVLQGFAVTTANGGGEAIQLLDSQDFDLVVCDVRMPGIGGIDVYRHLRERKPALAARMIFMSGDSFALSASDLGGASGGTICLEKPFSEDALRAAIGQALAPPAESPRSSAR